MPKKNCHIRHNVRFRRRMAQHCSIIFPLIGLIRFRQQFRMTNEYVLRAWSCAGAGSWHFELFDTCRVCYPVTILTHVCTINRMSSLVICILLALRSYPHFVYFWDSLLLPIVACGLIIMMMPLITQTPLKMNLFSNHNLLHDYTFAVGSTIKIFTNVRLLT